MPIYDYTCSGCRHLVEVIHGVYEAGPRFCPSCGIEGSMRKGFVTPAVHFKGSGWAKKDRSAAASSKSRSSKPAAEAGSGGDTTKAGAESTASSTSAPPSTSSTTTSTATSDGGD